jgi:hypothetical protein
MKAAALVAERLAKYKSDQAQGEALMGQLQAQLGALQAQLSLNLGRIAECEQLLKDLEQEAGVDKGTGKK